MATSAAQQLALAAASAVGLQCEGGTQNLWQNSWQLVRAQRKWECNTPDVQRHRCSS